MLALDRQMTGMLRSMMQGKACGMKLHQGSVSYSSMCNRDVLKHWKLLPCEKELLVDQNLSELGKRAT